MSCSSWLTLARSEPMPADAMPGDAVTAAKRVLDAVSITMTTPRSRRVRRPGRKIPSVNLATPSGAHPPAAGMRFIEGKPDKANQAQLGVVKWQTIRLRLFDLRQSDISGSN